MLCLLHLEMAKCGEMQVMYNMDCSSLYRTPWTAWWGSPIHSLKKDEMKPWAVLHVQLSTFPIFWRHLLGQFGFMPFQKEMLSTLFLAVAYGITEPGAGNEVPRQNAVPCPEARTYHLRAALLSTDSEGEHFSLPVPTQAGRLNAAYMVSSNLMLELRERCLG